MQGQDLVRSVLMNDVDELSKIIDVCRHFSNTRVIREVC